MWRSGSVGAVSVVGLMRDNTGFGIRISNCSLVRFNRRLVGHTVRRRTVLSTTHLRGRDGFSTSNRA